MLVARGEAIVEWLGEIIKKIWKGEQPPRDWRISEICPIYKKDEITNASNYRPIGLLPHAYKVMANIVRERNKRRM